MKDKYFPPAETENEIYGQLAEKKHLLIVKDMIKLLEKLGEGEFGEVYRGMFNSRTSQPMEVAVKVTKPDASLLDKIKFLQEATIMGQFNHRNVSKLFGRRKVLTFHLYIVIDVRTMIPTKCHHL